MATQQELQLVSLVAGADLSAKQFHFVVMSSDGKIDPATDGAMAIGVLQDTPNADGVVGLVAIGGIAKVKSGGNITAGAGVASNASGQAITAATGDRVVGIAMESGDSGDVIEVLLTGRAAVA